MKKHSKDCIYRICKENGFQYPPLKVNNMNKIKIFAEMVKTISKLSKDPSTKVGALILRPDNSIASIGYNGFPKGFPDNEEYWNDRELKYKIVKPAEENALDFCKDQCLEGFSIVVTHFPCPNCAGHLVQKGISKVYYIADKRKDHHCDITEEIFRKCNIEYEQIESE